jgi:leucyl/phenylalanyl-tRNA--protein transferase
VVLGPRADAPFPPPERACTEPDGLLAIGGGLEPERLLRAYAEGIFPWYEAGQPLLWWSPDPRAVFETDRMHLPRRLARRLRQLDWTVHADHDFDAVIRACASIPRRGQRGSWITPAMQAAYTALHACGHAHSIEVRDGDGTLIGGLYGVAVGQLFSGESMFSRAPGASQVALLALARRLSAWGWPLLDAQLMNPHTARFGAVEWPRATYLARIGPLVARDEPAADWRGRFGTLPAAALTQPAA